MEPVVQGDTMWIPLLDDFHIHLRQGNLMHLVTPFLEKGGVGRCYVMVYSLFLREKHVSFVVEAFMGPFDDSPIPFRPSPPQKWPKLTEKN